MKIVIYIVAILVGLVALLLIIAAFSRKKYIVTRTVTINKSSKEVFDYVKFLKNQEHYSKWVMTDPDKKITTEGVDGTVGFVYAWNGNDKAGEGSQKITELVDGKKVDTQITFIRPFAGIATATTLVDSVSANQSKVAWSFSSEMKYPMNFMLLLGMEKMLGTDMEISLGNMKKELE